MKQEELRAMVRASDTKPFRLCMDDSRTYVVNHPDFAMVADGALILGRGSATIWVAPAFVICSRISRGTSQPAWREGGLAIFQKKKADAGRNAPNIRHLSLRL